MARYKKELLNVFKNRINNNINDILETIKIKVFKTKKIKSIRMLWQIYAINNIKALYMKASSFEDKHKNLFNRNAQDRNLKSSIDAKIENIKFSDIIMIDDIDSVGFHYAAEGYYKLFDNIRSGEKTVILTSNKSCSNLMNSLNIKTRKDNIQEIKGRLTSRLKNLNIIELEMQKFEIKSYKLASQKIRSLLCS